MFSIFTEYRTHNNRKPDFDLNLRKNLISYRSMTTGPIGKLHPMKEKSVLPLFCPAFPLSRNWPRSKG